MPYPYGKRAPVQPLFVLQGSCVTALGQVYVSLPLKPASPNSTSVMPAPSVEPIHAATKAADWFSWGLMIMGRPENRSTTHLVTRLQMSETSVAAVLLSARGLVSPVPPA